MDNKTEPRAGPFGQAQPENKRKKIQHGNTASRSPSVKRLADKKLTDFVKVHSKRGRTRYSVMANKVEKDRRHSLESLNVQLRTESEHNNLKKKI